MANPSDAGVTAEQLRAARERVRPMVGSEWDWPNAGEQVFADVWLLAQADLAEHPADSELAVDEAWLRSVGFVPAGNPYWLWSPLGATRLRVCFGVAAAVAGQWVVAQYHDDDYSEEIPLPEQPTRGHVRRLAAALGVEPKGASS